MKILKLVTIICLLPLICFSQKLEIHGFIGASSYEGDVNKNDFIITQEVHPAFGIGAKYNFNQTMGLVGNFNMGKIAGDDQNFEDRQFWDPNLNFESSYQELTFSFEWVPIKGKKLAIFDENGDEYYPESENDETRIFNQNGMELTYEDGFFVGKDDNSRTYVYNKDGEYTVFNEFGLIEKEHTPKRFSPYLYTGIGVSIFNPNKDNGLPADAAELQDGAFSKLFLTMPIGGGLRWDFSRKLAIALDAAYRYPFSDYIDGISDSRDPLDNDWYLAAGIKIIYKLQQKKDFLF